MYGRAQKIALAGTVLGALLCASPASAQEQCRPTLLGRIQMVRDGKSGQFLVPVTINGAAKHMILNLGVLEGSIYRPVVEELGLPARPVALAIYDSKGNTSHDIASIGDMMIGPAHAGNLRLPVLPDPDAGRGTDIAGYLGVGMLFGQDVDIDLGSGLITLFSNSHCPSRLGYWESPPPDSTTFDTRGIIVLPAVLDGKKLRAYLATTNPGTSMRTDVAQIHFGLTADSPGMDPVKRTDTVADAGTEPPASKPDAPQNYYYTFESLSFAGVMVKKPRILVYQSVMSRYGDTSPQTRNRALRNNAIDRTDDIVLGMNLLRYLHIYIAPRERRIYMSGAFNVPGVSATPPPER